ncbi:MAG: ATP-binding domain-containing protein [Labilithrix sp.]|nr:ATP-binding domain-containing protein [Labilithrix sp.]MCW5814179.1 ATP-binding domain-containing protein [Labilithrix sp.]
MSAAETNETAPIPGLEDDEDGSRIVREEMRLLETVLKNLGPAPPERDPNDPVVQSEMAAQLADDDRRLLELRDLAASAKPEDLPMLFEQMHTLGALRAHRGKGITGSVDRKSPYFGHLRLEEQVLQRGGKGQGKERRRDVLIGSRQYLDAAAGIRIVDWRNAPVSRIFYRYREGDSYEETLGDQPVEGEVAARRTVAIVDGELRKVTAPQGTFVKEADGTWRRAAAHTARLRLPAAGTSTAATPPKPGKETTTSADRLLPAIAAMLDKEQYDLITKPGIGLVAIQGSAGSGKTTVGLHRVAYLHASQPNRYRGSRMLVIVPNEALVHYTSRVLPALGVDGVPVLTFHRWAVRVVMDLFPRLPSAISDETPPLVSRLKNHPAMLEACASIGEEAMTRVDAKVRATMAKWPEGERVIAAWDATKGAPDRRVTQLAQWLAGKRDLANTKGSGDLPNVTRSAVESMGQELRSETRNVLGAWDEVTTSRPRLDRFFGKYFGTGQLDQVHEWCTRQARVRTEHERDGETPSLDLEDRALLLRLFQVLRGPLLDGDGQPLTCAHLFIDEVQDASPVELKVLLEVARGTADVATDLSQLSVTLAGDTAQRMREEDDEHVPFDWDATLKELGVPGGAKAIDPLKVSYRSTAPITAFARGVLGPFAHEAEPIAPRGGPPVEAFTFASAGEAVAFLADALRELAANEPDANVALLSRFPQQAEMYFEGLQRAEVPNVRRVRRQDFTWERGFDVTDVRQTKGLEFDEVILLETTASSYPDTAQARHALYVGATRAAHQLWCLSSESPSKLVQEGLAASAAAPTE